MRALGWLGWLAMPAIVAACGTPDEPHNTLDLPGIDQHDLTAREQKEFSELVTSLYAPCPDVAVPVAQCVKEKRACDKCGPAARFVFRGVHDGLTRDQIQEGYHDRYDPAGAAQIPIDGSPSIGPENAKVTIVEFADFECPACGQLAPHLDKIVQDHPNDVRLVYKFYPLVHVHPRAEAAALAGAAAILQGKFWPMHHVMFANQELLHDDDLARYAKAVGMDVDKFEKDVKSKEVADVVARDVALGDSLHLRYTPSVFVNGRYVDRQKHDLDQWVEEELKE